MGAMSKLNIDNLKKGIQQILDGAKEKPRKFLETVELQIGLKDYDTQRDKRFAGTVKLPHVPRPRMKICVLGDAVHCEQAQKGGIPFKSVDDLKKLKKNKDMRSNVKFQLKKVLCMGVAVGNVGMTPDELRQNCLMAINFLVSLLKKNWNNVKRLHIKSTMGKPYTVYG